ncbi:hypothetical protein [Bradyrhizobium sp.]|jgi:hypothetical protein|uniref:hypothetical protein n=1 Tax=Bradyrhizobium sp. TaxID=376 RepID=UPI002C677687|nr:hypothetical protein [Bradyrhizobium sp.]HWX59120.1 hypothetical protein [Bradyrhizobium sp.]
MRRKQSENLARRQETGADALKTLRELRRAAREEIDRLIAFLDESEIDLELEDDEVEIDAADEPEHDPGENGIADYEGLLEQCPHFYRHSERVE